MNEQRELFELPIDRPAVDVDTSQAAAESMRERAETLRARVLLTLAAHGGLTQDECERATELTGNTLRPRFWELERRGLIRRSDDRRPTRSGRMAHVYRTTARGAEVAGALARCVR